MVNNLTDKLKSIPDSPGVYQYFDELGTLLYVGKAKSLKKRVASYFHRARAHDARIQNLVGEIRDIKYIVTASEEEAFIYEAGLIKDHKPRYNIELKDDKSYPYLKLTVNEEYPRLVLTRKRAPDGALYYGPYPNAGLLKKALSFMRKVFPLRSCVKLHKKVCLEYHMEQCPGVCEGKVPREAYISIVEQLRSFLEARKDGLISSLENEMKAASSDMEYERALKVKGRIEALTAVRSAYNRSGYPVFGELEELRNIARLNKDPRDIECFDISNISGRSAVGSMVKFTGGKPFKKGYRKFRIRTVPGADDYSMIREVVRRRYTRLIAEGVPLPDLVMIDGGKGHLSSAKEVLDSLGMEDVDIVSIAKEFDHLYTVKSGQPFPGIEGAFSHPARPRRGAPVRDSVSPDAEVERGVRAGAG
ncbi:MAG: excinuclease ABC subunit UvrC [Candidatus Omnitrophica bacterium]|nr:excinuclease ABC subunit UvrC [Candidatus Omnitrophota bacterium]